MEWFTDQIAWKSWLNSYKWIHRSLPRRSQLIIFMLMQAMILNLKRELSTSRLKSNHFMLLLGNQPCTILWAVLRLIRKRMLSISKDKLSEVSTHLESSWRIACRKPFRWQFPYWYFHFWTYCSRNCYYKELLILILRQKIHSVLGGFLVNILDKHFF